MSKRKSSADLRRGFNAPGRRPSAANLQARAMNTIHRKPGATNVRSTSSYKIVRSHADTQHNNSHIPGSRKSSVTRTGVVKMPKTRFDLANSCNTHMPRLKHFPVESVRKTVADWSYSPSSTRKFADQEMCERVETPTTDANANTWAKNLPSHGYGDTLKVCPAYELMQPSQKEAQSQQTPKQAITHSQQHMPTEQYVSRVNQSEAMLNGRVSSAAGQPIRRPFVPNVAHGMGMRTLSPQKSTISPRLLAQQSYELRAEAHQQQEREQASSTAVEQMQQPRVPVCQQVSQISRQSMADQPNQTAPTFLRNKIPWVVDDSPTVCDYETQPIGGRRAVARGPTSGLDEKPDAQRQVVATRQPTSLGQEPCNLPSMQQWEKKQQQHHPHQQQLQQQQQPHQQQLHQQQQQQEQLQQQRQYLNRQGLSTVKTIQNAYQMYQQLQNNIIRQQEMQQRALSQQQQMVAMSQQQMKRQPLAHQLNMPVQDEQMNREPFSNYYNPQQIYNGQLPNSTQDTHVNKMSIPHHRMLMQQRNAVYRPSQINPQHDRVPNHQAIDVHPSLKSQLKPFAVNLVSPVEKGMLSNDMNRYEQLKRNEGPLTANQHLAQQVAGIQWQQGTSYPQYDTAIPQYPPIQQMQPNPNQASSQQYLSAQQEHQVSTLRPQSSMIHQHQKQQQQHQQQQQHEQQQQLQQQQLQTMKQSQAVKKKYPEFTTEMIRDQELLVANMRQQKIPENIMRRQFDALLSEQRRYLAFLSRQELVEKINHTSPRRSFRVSQEDQRPDWMGRITPARITVQDQKWQQMVPEQMKHYDHTQQEISPHILKNSQDSKIHLRQLHNLNRQDGYHSWQPQAANQQHVAGLPAPSSYNIVSLPQMLSPPQGTVSRPPPNNGPRSDAQCLSVQFNDFQTQSEQQLQQQQTLQHQYQQQHQEQSQMRYGLQPNHLQQMHQTQVQQSMNCQQTEQVEHITPEQYQQRDKMMQQEIKGECGNNSNLSKEQHCAKFKPNEPSSLLKMREYQKYTRPQMQNNGLQDAETVRAALEALNSPEVTKGLEYAADLGKKVTALKLNGTQDPSELRKISPPPAEYLQRIQQQQQPKVSSNGLCNTRNANNPASAPISFPKNTDRSLMVGYPRRFYPGEKPQMNMTQGTHKMMAEKENGSVAGAMQQDQLGTVFTGYGQTLDQFSPIQVNARGQYLPQQLNPINGRCQRLTIPCNGKNPSKPLGSVPIMPYKFDGSEPLYQQEMEQFYRNRINLKNSAENNMTKLAEGPDTSKETALVPQVLQTSIGNIVQPEASRVRSNIPDHIHQQGSSPVGEMVAPLWQSANHTYQTRDVTEMAENKEAIAHCLRMQQTNAGNNNGQPEIRVPKTIGGLTYLARRVDCIQNPPLIAPHTLIDRKYLQPLVSLN